MACRAEDVILDELLVAHLYRGQAVRFVARGLSMWPSVLDGDRVTVAPMHGQAKLGQIVCVQAESRFLVHRVIALGPNGRVKTRGDALTAADGWFEAEKVHGRVVGIRRKDRHILFSEALYRVGIAKALGQCRRSIRRFRSG